MIYWYRLSLVRKLCITIMILRKQKSTYLNIQYIIKPIQCNFNIGHVDMRVCITFCWNFCQRICFHWLHNTSRKELQFLYLLNHPVCLHPCDVPLSVIIIVLAMQHCVKYHPLFTQPFVTLSCHKNTEMALALGRPHGADWRRSQSSGQALLVTRVGQKMLQGNLYSGWKQITPRQTERI